MPCRTLIEWILTVAFIGCWGTMARTAPPEGAVPLPSKEETLQTIERFARAMTSGDLATADGLMDWDAVLDTAMAGVEASDRFRESYRLGLKRTLTGDLGLIRKTRRSLEEGGTIRLLRVRQTDGQTRALLRIWPARDSLMYDELLLARRNDGAIRVVDVYRFASGELMSESLRRSYIQAAVGQGGQKAKKGTSNKNEFAAHLATISEMSDRFRKQRFAESLAAYRQLPESLQLDKNLLLLRLSAAQHLGATEYTAAIDAFRAAFPRDPALDLVLFDYYLRNGMATEGLACVQRIDDAVGGDPGLACSRAQLYLAAGQFDDARREANLALAAEPRQAGIYWTLMQISAGQRDYAETVRLLRTLQQELHVTRPDLAKIAAFAKFVKSPEYVQWRGERGRK